jgi:hypothetical protein
MSLGCGLSGGRLGCGRIGGSSHARLDRAAILAGILVADRCSRFHNTVQHHKTATRVGNHAQIGFVTPGQSGCRRLEVIETLPRLNCVHDASHVHIARIATGRSGRCRRNVIETGSGLNCVHDAANVGTAGKNGTARRIVRRAGESFTVERDRLLRRNQLGATIDQLQIDSRAIGCFDNLTLQHHIAFLEEANLTLGIGGGDCTMYVGGSSCGGCGHDVLLI